MCRLHIFVDLGQENGPYSTATTGLRAESRGLIIRIPAANAVGGKTLCSEITLRAL